MGYPNSKGTKRDIFQRTVRVLTYDLHQLIHKSHAPSLGASLSIGKLALSLSGNVEWISESADNAE